MIRKKLTKPLSVSIFSLFGVFCPNIFASADDGWSLPVNNFNLPDDLDGIIMNLTNWLLGFVVLIAVIAIIWGGVNYIASSGDAQKAELSKKIIYYAFIGVFIAGISYAVINVIVTIILR